MKELAIFCIIGMILNFIVIFLLATSDEPYKSRFFMIISAIMIIVLAIIGQILWSS